MIRRIFLALGAAIVAVLMGAVPALAAGAPHVVSPDRKYAGKTYGQWSAAWWKWIAAIPEPGSPVTDTTGEDCAVHQRGAVWFLAGTTGSDVTRSCTVPAGRAIFFPMINAECSEPEGNGSTVAELRACAAALMDGVTEISASIDGRMVDVGTPSTSPFRVRSPGFTITWADGNGFGVPPGTGLSVGDGYYILVTPLKPGHHTIDLHGAVPGFSVTAHYDLTVRPC